MVASPILQPDELFHPDEPLEVPPMELDDMIVMSDGEDVSHGSTAQHIRTICPTPRSIAACAGWKALIPTIIDPFLKYTAATLRQPLVALGSRLSSCTSSCQEQKLTAVLCLFFDRVVSIDVLSCLCCTLPQTLVSHGLFPTVPTQPRMAVSINLLSFFRTLFERLCDTIHALASALGTYYTRRGFRMMDNKGRTVRDPFQRSLSQAAQWYNILQVDVEKQVDSLIQQCCLLVKPAIESLADLPSGPLPPTVQQHSLSRGSCSETLIQRCPVCFGGTLFGRLLDKGGDMNVATDAQVDAIGRHITHAHQRPSKLFQSVVPDEAIDQCEASYKAADGQKQKTAMDNFDNTGVMVLICRHDIPLFLANIDTPGEQQKYSIALISHLFSLLPDQANVVVLYDVGCVLARSLAWFNILDQQIMSRLRFATTAMHAYGHEWACQLVYNPHRRIWLLDRHAATVGYEMQRELGDWLRCRLKKGVGEQGSAAQEVLDDCGVSVMELQKQWSDQQATQLSIRAHAPAKLKKELDTVLTLQADLDNSNRVLQLAQVTIEKGNASPAIMDVLESLEHSHSRLMTKAEALYSSLNVHDQFPELKNISLDFVQILLMARDLKINIHKRAVGTFFEWDKLDRAIGGKDKPLGTKLHQQTRKAIVKHQPALMAAIHKYNLYYIWITPSVGEVPRWLKDMDVRDGIRALIKTEHCLEEQCCLGLEADNMCRWFGYELAAVQVALRQSENGNYYFILKQRLETISKLQERWPTALSSPARYASQMEVATWTAETITGKSQPSLCWLVPVVINDYINDVDDEELWGLTDGTGPAEPPLDPKQVALSDVLEVADQDGFEPEVEAETPPRITLNWELPEVINIDGGFDMAKGAHVPANMMTVIQPSVDGFPRQTFLPSDTSILASPQACLNDACINGCAALLYSVFLPAAASCAVLLTHDLPRIRYNTDDETLWRNVSWTRFCEKPIWVLPIHRSSPVGHWVLCAIYFPSRRLLLFDSLAEQQPWRKDVKDIMRLVCHLSNVVSRRIGTSRRDLGDWVAQPLLNHGKPMDTIAVCGSWRNWLLF
ncbi:hypothetical protein SCLCIDRAFT_29357 [Scleroderma citrinum Foug A]|uniref:Uncharacterized protein n=1 Tax=Scleroderma citrinum Foug A TaxID=1036808 RepID=A0A0C2Z434_9AGAM|nr:hypothetical protein SCLCIDRAFT_29357 [Scleroderma citrinum Foug A]